MLAKCPDELPSIRVSVGGQGGAGESAGCSLPKSPPSIYTIRGFYSLVTPS